MGKKIFVSSVLAFLFMWANAAADWTVPMTVKVGTANFSLNFATQAGATDGWDVGVDIEAPPAMPGGENAFFYIVDDPWMLSTDVRSAIDSNIVWTLTTAPAVPPKADTIRWDPLDLPAEGIFMFDTAGLNLDMSVDSMAAYSGAQTLYLTYNLIFIPSRDVGPDSILSPPDSVTIGGTYDVIVRVKNFGLEAETPQVECIIVGEGETYADTQYAFLDIGGTDDVIFDDWTVPPDAKGTFTMTVVTLLGPDEDHSNDTLTMVITSYPPGVEEDTEIPTKYELLSVFPNPVTKNAKIRYAIPSKSRIDMKIYDITGKLVTILKNGVIEEPGYKVANWNMTDVRGEKVNSGIYFCNLEIGTESSTKKILVIK